MAFLASGHTVRLATHRRQNEEEENSRPRNALRNRVARWFPFQTKNPYLGKFWRALDWKIWIYFKAIWNILLTFEIFYDHLVHFSGFGILYQEKSGNPGIGRCIFRKNVCSAENTAAGSGEISPFEKHF
jgi:hypothetical protein